MWLQGILIPLTVVIVFHFKETKAQSVHSGLHDLYGLGSPSLKSLPGAGPVNVKVLYLIENIQEANVEQGYIETSGFLRKIWTDPRLVVSSRHGATGNATGVGIDPDLVWTPDIVVFNAVSTGYILLNERQSLAWVSMDRGEVMLVEQITLRSQCNIRAQLAKGDTFTCNMIFGSSNYGVDQISVILDTVEGDGPTVLSTDYFVPAGQWTVTEAIQKRAVKQFPSFDGLFSYVKFSYTFQRIPEDSGEE